jgi:hypothetical protein
MRRQPGVGTCQINHAPPQGASSSSKPVNWKSAVLVYHHGVCVWFQQISGLGASSTGVPPQSAGGAGKPVDEGDLRYEGYMVDRLHSIQTKCLEFQNESYSLSREPAALACYLRELIVSTSPRLLRR